MSQLDPLKSLRCISMVAATSLQEHFVLYVAMHAHTLYIVTLLLTSNLKPRDNFSRSFSLFGSSRNNSPSILAPVMDDTMVS